MLLRFTTGVFVAIAFVFTVSPVLAVTSNIESGVRRANPSRTQIASSGEVRNNKDCLQDKTLYFAGNSLTRGWYFSMGAMLEGLEKTGIKWTDRSYQKKMCQKERSWPPTPSCSMVVGDSATLLVNSWTQTLNELKADLEEFFGSYRPDVTIVEIGFEHIAHEWNLTERGTPLWEVTLEEQFEPIAEVVQRYYTANPDKRILWRAIPPFNENACSNEHLKNEVVAEWNRKLHAQIERRQWLDKPWFQWDEGAVQLMEQALQERDGLRMDDWIHPDANTHLLMAKGIMQSICDISDV